MARASFLQTSFLGGEWSTLSQGRIDLPAYKTALASCLNSLPMEEAAVVRRPGTQHAGTTKGGLPGRVIPFALSSVAPITMEFTDNFVRFRMGPNLMYESATAKVTNITGADPALVAVNIPTPWVTGDEVFFIFNDEPSKLGLGSLTNRVFKIQTVNSSTFVLTDPVSGATIPGTGFVWSNTYNVTMAKVRALPTPYRTGFADWRNLRSVQNEYVTTLLHGGEAPFVLQAFPQPVTVLPNQFVPTLSNLQFQIGIPNFLDGPYMDVDPTAFVNLPLNEVGPGSVTVSLQAGTVNNGRGFVATDAGRIMRIHNEPQNWNQTGATYGVGDAVKFADGYYRSLQASNTGHYPDSEPTWWEAAPSAHVWTWGIIQSVSTSNTVIMSIRGPALLYKASVQQFNQFAMGLYSNTTGWPTCGCFHEGRLWLAGSQGNRFDASVSNGASDVQVGFNFAPTDQFGQVVDSSAIAYTLNSKEVNPIFWLEPNAAGITAGTQGNEWLIQATNQNLAITPTNIQAHPVTKYGCANIEPRRTGLTTVFVQKLGRRCLEYLSDVFSGKFYGPNLNEFTRHLTVGGLAEIAYQEEPLPVLWARTNRGALVGSTYRRISLFSSEPPKFNAWHRHQIGSGRTVESICTGTSPDGLSEALTLVTNDPLTGTRHVEILTQPPEEGTLLTGMWYLDDAVVPSCGQSVIQGGVSGILFSGLSHLNGKSATAWLCGIDAGDYNVVNGQMFVPFNGYFLRTTLNDFSIAGGFGAFTVSIDNGALQIPAVIGFSFTSEGQLLRQVEAQAAGTKLGPALGKKRRVDRSYIAFDGAVSGTVSVGTDLTGRLPLHPAYFTNEDGSAIDPTQLFTGVWFDSTVSESDFESQLAWRITRPQPCSITMIEGSIMTQD